MEQAGRAADCDHSGRVILSLMLPRASLGLTQNNLTATPSQAAHGTSVPASSTANTKSSWVQLFAATNFDVWGITLSLGVDSASAAVRSNLYDIGVGPAASEQVLLSNIMSTAGGNIATNPQFPIFIPVFIPAGVRVAARHQSNASSQGCRLVMFLHGGATSPPWAVFSGGDGIGVDTTDSGGLSHTAGSTGVESTWTNLGSTLARSYGAMLPMIGLGTDSNLASGVYHAEFGIGSTTMAEYMFGTSSTEYITCLMPNIPFYGNFPAGTQMQVRAECSGAADDLDYALLGLY